MPETDPRGLATDPGDPETELGVERIHDTQNCGTSSQLGRSQGASSGGCIVLSGHLLKSWSKNQSVVATSSGGAELYASSKGGGELLGIRSIAADLGLKLGLELQVDPNATVGMLHRKGLSKMRHIEVASLWM